MSQEGHGRPRFTRFLVWTVAAIAAGVLVWAVPETIRFLPEAPGGFWSIALASLIVDIPLFAATRREDLRVRSTLSVCFTFAIFVVWGAGPAITVQTVAGAVSAVGQRYHPMAGLYLVSRLVCAAAVAELVLAIADPRPLTMPGGGLTGGELLAFGMLAVVWFTVSYGLLAAARSTMSPHGLRQATSEMRFDLGTTAVAVLLVAPLLTAIVGWSPLLLALPLIVWNQLNREQLRYERRLGREPVSGLLNRQGLVDGVQTIISGDLVAPHGPRPFAIIVVNAEAALEINRTLGRDLYEKVVGVAARRLVDAYGSDRAARLSGEGIVILIPDLTEPDASTAARTAASILEPLIEVDGIPFALNPVAGVALSPQHGRELGSLLTKAELAAAEARRTGRSAAVYLREAAVQTERHIAVLRELHTVLRVPARHSELVVLYQPQVDLATGRLSAVEALLRWTHPRWGPVPTEELINAIEPTEIMHELTRHVLDVVAAQVRRWNEQGDHIRVSVNVSLRDLHEPGFVDELGELIRRYGIAARQLVMEITERTLIADLARASRVAGTLSALGVGLSLDDFGTGYASLRQLRELPLTEVKVDRSYVSSMIDDPADKAIVTSLHRLTRALGIDIVAEGVEDQRTADALAALTGTIGQGRHFGRPMTVEDLRDWRHHRGAGPGPT